MPSRSIPKAGPHTWYEGGPFVELIKVWGDFGYKSYLRAKFHATKGNFPIVTFRLHNTIFMDREVARVYFCDKRLEAARALVKVLEADQTERELKAYKEAMKKLPKHLR